MKVQVTFKTPDAIDFALEDVPEDQKDEVRKQLKKYIKYEEYAILELDTDTGNVTVLPA